jgi:heme A synthase
MCMKGVWRDVTAIHDALYTTLLLLSGGLTLWALFFLVRGQPVDGAFRSTYVLTIGASVLQAMVGVIMLVNGQRPASSFHFLYGVSLIVFTGFGYALATRGDSRREALTFGIASAAAFGLILRAAATAHG